MSFVDNFLTNLPSRMAISNTASNTAKNTANQVLGKVLGTGAVADVLNSTGLFNINEDWPSNVDPLIDFMYRCTMPTVGGITIPPVYVRSVRVPTYRIESSSTKFGRYGTNYANGGSTTDLSIGLYEDQNLKVLTYSQAWMNLIFNRSTKTFGLPSDYKMYFPIEIIGPDDISVGYITAVGAYIDTVSGFDLDVGGTKVVSPTLNFKVDDCYVIISETGIVGSIGSIVSDILRGNVAGALNRGASIITSAISDLF